MGRASPPPVRGAPWGPEGRQVDPEVAEMFSAPEGTKAPASDEVREAALDARRAGPDHLLDRCPGRSAYDGGKPVRDDSPAATLRGCRT